jgi:phosphatidylglycerophosphate synthase
MMKQAVILIPGMNETPPSFLFQPVAGVPFLWRQVLGLRRAGITDITVLAAPATQEYLTREFTRRRYLSPHVQIISRWPGCGESSDTTSGTGYYLTLPVNILPDPKIYRALCQNPPPPGGVVLGVLTQSPQIPAGDGTFCLVRKTNSELTASQATGPITSLTFSGSQNGLQASGLALFSAEAWKDWYAWQIERDAGLFFNPDSLLNDFCDYLAPRVPENQVLQHTLDPAGIFFINNAQDQEAVTSKLIAAQNYAPIGEGILENSWNRKIARLILPWFLTSKITPNQITFASLLVGLLAVWGFSQGSYRASVGAALLLPLIMVLDCLDGALARLTFQESRLGALLDLHGDTVVNLLLFGGISLGSYRSSGRPLFLAAGLLLTFGYMACWWYNIPDLKTANFTVNPDLPIGNSTTMLEEATSRDFFYIILLMAIVNLLDWMIVATALGTIIFAVIFYRRKSNGKN